MDQLYTKRYTKSMCDSPKRNISDRLIITQWALFSLATVFVALRFISRMPQSGGCLGLDDWIMLPVLLLSLSVNVISHLLLSAGVGQDIWMLEDYQLSMFLKVCILYIYGDHGHRTYVNSTHFPLRLYTLLRFLS